MNPLSTTTAKDASDEFSPGGFEKAIREGLENQASSRADNELCENGGSTDRKTHSSAQSWWRNVEQLVSTNSHSFPKSSRAIWNARGPAMKEESRPKALRQVRASLLLESLTKT